MMNSIPTNIHSRPRVQQPLLLVIMDGVGERHEVFGNAVHLAHTPCLDQLREHQPFCRLWAHGPHVGLASLDDMGNSEVGHNTMGAGRIYNQGAQCVLNALQSGTIFQTPAWHKLINHLRAHRSCLHFLGLLSDGNVHSHQDHLHILMAEACRVGISKIRLHLLFDGRDVHPKSAPRYLQRLIHKIAELQQVYSADIKVASGGGRMNMTMDRYEADWEMVKRGWQHHVMGQGVSYSSIEAYLAYLQTHDYTTDQYLQGFIIEHQGEPCGRIQDGDGVLCFNFRADRAIQITRAFCESDFTGFTREFIPKVLYVGLTCYDGDRHCPQDFLVQGPQITESLSWLMCEYGVRQWACSETQKFGHVTFFWNGNRSLPFDPTLETYSEIPSHLTPPVDHPAMQAAAITELTIKSLSSKQYDFLRINYPNGDMVGHSGNLDAAITAMSVVDTMIGRLMVACQRTGTALIVTADHGNCELMQTQIIPQTPTSSPMSPRSPRSPIQTASSLITPVTSHSLNQVPFYLYNSQLIQDHPRTAPIFKPPTADFAPGLAHLAATTLEVMGLPPYPHYEPSLLQLKST